MPPARPPGPARLVVVLALAAACRTAPPPTAPPPAPAAYAPSPAERAFLDTLERRTFDYFWLTTNARNGLVPDRWPTPSFSSIAAVGFGLTGYLIGAERGWISREGARRRVLNTLRFFRDAPQGPDTAGVAGYRGFFYHFLDMESGRRYRDVELSTIDTGLLLMGVLACRAYFDGDHPAEREIRAAADTIYARVEWDWARDGGASVTMGWHPEPGRGFLDARWVGYNEAMLLYALALGSPTHPVDQDAWAAWTQGYRWDAFGGQAFVQFGPLFGHQYSHAWIDFRGIRDAYMAARGGPSAAGGGAAMDYAENSRRATLAQHRYAAENPGGWRDYSDSAWGLTASDGPIDGDLVLDGRPRRLHTYWARGAGAVETNDDGTLAPTAVGGSVPFAPEVAIPTLLSMRRRWGDALFGRYGFVDAFNPTLADPGVPVTQGRVVPGVGWFDTDYLGIDQGPILLMLENYRSGFVWSLMQRDPHVVRGLCRAGFTGGWIEGKCR